VSQFNGFPESWNHSCSVDRSASKSSLTKRQLSHASTVRAGTDTRLRWAAGLALIGCIISAYLALFQYGALSRVFDPVFGGASSARVLNYDLLRPVNRAIGLTIHDGLVGSLAYALEGCLALVLARSTRNTPLTVVYAATVVLAGLTGFALVALQAFAVGHWCALCLLSAGISELILILSLGELCAAWTATKAFFGRAFVSRIPLRARRHVA